MNTMRGRVPGRQETLQKCSSPPLCVTLDYEGVRMRSTPSPDIQGPADLGPADSPALSPDIFHCHPAAGPLHSLYLLPGEWSPWRGMWLAPSPPLGLSSLVPLATKLLEMDTPKVSQCWGMEPCWLASSPVDLDRSIHLFIRSLLRIAVGQIF